MISLKQKGNLMKKLVITGLILSLAYPLFGGGEETAPEMAPKDTIASSTVVSPTTTPETAEAAAPETTVSAPATTVTGVETPETSKTTTEPIVTAAETPSEQVTETETVTEPAKEVTTPTTTKAPVIQPAEEDISINLDNQEGTFDIDEDMFDTSVDQL